MPGETMSDADQPAASHSTDAAAATAARRSRARERIRRWGTTSWWLVGMMLAVALGYSLVIAFSGLVVPLLLAVVVGALGVPVVDWLQKHHIPRPAGAMLFIAVLVSVLIGTTLLAVNSIVHETLEIRSVLIDGVDQVDDWLANGDALGDADSIVQTGYDQAPTWLSGVATWATTVFSSTMTFAIGAFLATFMLYYILVDWNTVRYWVARHLGVPGDLGAAILDDATQVVRRGFGALTLTSLVTASVIGVAMLVLDLPLVFAVVGVTFITSYVPYLGAIVSGVFAFLVALGSGGTRDAFILVIVVLVAQNVIQTVVGNRLTSDRLALHPLPSIISSVCGVAIAGLLGAMLSAPALALAIAVNRRMRSPELVRRVGERVGERDGDDPPSETVAAERAPA